MIEVVEVMGMMQKPGVSVRLKKRKQQQTRESEGMRWSFGSRQSRRRRVLVWLQGASFAVRR